MAWYNDVWDFVTGQSAKTYSNLAKTGVAALSTYAAWKDQQKKNEMQQAAYDDYMAQAEAAGHQAQAAVDINLTPMTVSGVPTTKADVTDFTAVAAQGGLMSIPTKQRKRYARGPEEFEVQEMEEEIFSPGDFKMETGVDVLGEQVFYDTGRGDRANASQIWDQMQNPDKAIFDFDFEIFFMDGGWRDQIKSQIEVGTETQMASHEVNDQILESLYEEHYDRLKGLGHNDDAIHKIIIDMFYDMSAAAPKQEEGIMQAAHGGRIGYATKGIVDENIVTDFDQPPPKEEDIRVVIERIASESANPETFPSTDSDFQALAMLSDKPEHFPSTDSDFEIILRIANEINVKAPEQSKGEIYAQYMAKGGRTGFGSGSKPKYKKFLKLLSDLEERSPELMAWGLMGASTIIPFLKKGGRVKKETGGIMNLGGLEKDYRTTGGFVPIGEYEKKDDVPARLSKNEFVFTADAVRAAGGGSINKGAQRMYDTMKHLEARPTAKRMTA